MGNKNNRNSSPLVYSTDPNYVAPGYDDEQEMEEIPVKDQKIKVLRSTKHRAGKIVTLVTNLIASEEEQEKIGKQLKTFCGTGGAVKDGEIIVQGDHRDKVIIWLHKNGYISAKKI